jgi:seryl-tRNA synthetase
MHDVKAIREDPVAYVQAWTARGVAEAEAHVEAILDDDRALRAAQTAFQAAQGRRNEASKLIGQAKAQGRSADAEALMAEVEGLKGSISAYEEVQAQRAQALHQRLAALPNLAAPETPDGQDETDNVEIRRWGDRSGPPAGRLNSTPKDHVILGEALGMMNFEAARRMSGARFVVLTQDLARMERALGQFMLDLQTQEHGYCEVSPPLLVKPEASFGVGHLPKFAEDQFWALPGGVLRAVEDAESVTRGAPAAADARARALGALQAERLGLIPTAEVSLTNLVREQITPEETLPLRLTALTPCFRSEAGASGRDTRGMIRQHQFWKCELVSITTAETSAEEHERMTECAEAVLKRLGLPFRTMLLCKGDMGFSARKTYDLEVWLPSQNTYREISSCSNCGDFQARRMDARSRKAGEKGGRFVHTLNGSGLAVGRTLVAVMENYQDEGGRIAIPEALQGYMGGRAHIGAPP